MGIGYVRSRNLLLHIHKPNYNCTHMFECGTLCTGAPVIFSKVTIVTYLLLPTGTSLVAVAVSILDKLSKFLTKPTETL